MDSSSPKPPVSASQIFPSSFKLSPKQHDVLEAIKTFPRGARAIDVAEKLGMHVNTVRGHLEELEKHKAVYSISAAAAGRGRPYLIYYSRTPEPGTITDEYIALIEMLVEHLDSPEQAEEIGRQWARASGSGPGQVEKLVELLPHLHSMGFDPTVDSEEAVTLHACPFVGQDGQAPSPQVCQIHAGYLKEKLVDSRPLKLWPFNTPGTCSVIAEQD